MSNSKRNWAKFGVGVKLIVILRHIIAYFSINIRWHSQNVSSDSRKWLIKHLFPPSSCKKQINKQNSYLLLAFLQSGSVPELDMYESKHFLPGPFVHSGECVYSKYEINVHNNNLFKGLLIQKKVKRTCSWQVYDHIKIFTSLKLFNFIDIS